MTDNQSLTGCGDQAKEKGRINMTRMSSALQDSCQMAITSRLDVYGHGSGHGYGHGYGNGYGHGSGSSTGAMTGAGSYP